MKLALISPVPHLKSKKDFSSIHMVLGHMCIESEDYTNFYSCLKLEKPTDYIICDNSANEGHMIKGKELLSLAQAINADEIIAPDKYHDCQTTIQETQNFLDQYYESDIKGRLSVMAVPQGKTLEDLLYCYDTFIKDPRINVIGIGYRNLIPALWDEIFVIENTEWYEKYKIKNVVNLFNNLEDNCFNFTMSRVVFLLNYLNFRSLKKNNKQIHLLGLYNPYELYILNRSLTRFQKKFVRSCDSASPWQAAQVDILFDPEFGVKTKPKAFVDFYQILTPSQEIIFEKNLSLLKEWAKHV